jgi:hypothetical protein
MKETVQDYGDGENQAHRPLNEPKGRLTESGRDLTVNQKDDVRCGAASTIKFPRRL